METPKPSTPSDQKLHFLDYWRIIRIRKTVILAVFLLVVLTTTAVTFILPKSYRSTVRMEIGKDTTDIAPLLMGVPNQSAYDPYFIQTEFEKIRSKAVLHRVIEMLALDQRWAERYKLPEKLQISQAFELLNKQIDVRQFRNTTLIEVQVYSDQAKEAAEIANTIAEVYREWRQSKSRGASTNSIGVLRAQLTEQKKKLLDAQKQVDDLRAQYGVADIDAGGFQAMVEPEMVRMFERQRAAEEIKLSSTESLLNQILSLPPARRADSIPTLMSYQDAMLTDLLVQRTMAENALSTISFEAGPENPKFIASSNIVRNLSRQIDERVQGIIAGLSNQAGGLRAQIGQLEKKAKASRDTDAEMMSKYRPYFSAKRELDTQQRIFDAINMRVLQETVDAALPKSFITEVTDPAEVSPKPDRPRIPLNIALGVIVGLIMGFGLAFFIEYLDTSVKTIDDVERALQAPVLGVIPQNVGALIHEGPDSPHAEAYRVLRTNLLFSKKNPDGNTLTVVSGGAGEGKSTTIFNLATVFAQNGSRVLIVDSDLRRPSLHKLLNVSNSLGLTNYLLKQNTLEEVVQTTTIPTLFFLPSGKLPSSSLGILNSTQMKEFIQRAKREFDYVFFDSPPIMGVSDASVLASEVDMAILVIQYRKYPQAMTIRAKQMVEKVGGTLLGVVLNNINISQDSYYYYYSGYYYDYYSKQDDDGTASKVKKNGEGKTVAGDRGSIDLKKKY